MDDFEEGRADRSIEEWIVDELIEFVDRQSGISITQWQEQFIRTVYGIPVIESPYVPEGDMYLLGGHQVVMIKTAIPIVPHGEIWCERGSHGSLRSIGTCPFCGAIV